MRPYPSNNKVLDGMEKRRKMNRRLFPGLLMTNKCRLYSQRNMYQVISFTCLALYFHLPYLRRILISKFLMKLKPFNERYTKTQPHKTSTCFIPVSNFWNRSQNPRSSFRSIEIFMFPVFFVVMSSSLEGIHGEKMTRFDLTDLASSPTSPDVGGSKVVVVASSIEPSTDLRAVSLSSLPLGTWNISDQTKM